MEWCLDLQRIFSVKFAVVENWYEKSYLYIVVSIMQHFLGYIGYGPGRTRVNSIKQEPECVLSNKVSLLELQYGGTLLHEAVDLCSPQMVQLVLRTGANVNATTKV